MTLLFERVRSTEMWDTLMETARRNSSPLSRNRGANGQTDLNKGVSGLGRILLKIKIKDKKIKRY